MGGFSLNALAAPLLTPLGGNDRILVLIRLKGGNDGLNTIIPIYDFGTYKTNGLPFTSLSLKLGASTRIGYAQNYFQVDKAMEQWCHESNQRVGYDNHNLSHFTSSDVWNSAKPEIESIEDKSGWLARYLLHQQPDYLENLPEIPGAIKVNSGSNIAFNNPDRIDLAVNFNTRIS